MKGSNFTLLCNGTKADNTESLFLVVVYADLQGNGTVTSVGPITY